jgi:hypothetical protein
MPSYKLPFSMYLKRYAYFSIMEAFFPFTLSVTYFETSDFKNQMEILYYIFFK